MPEKFPTNVWTRAQWQTERDGKKVPKGAAKVSVGDALDKFHKAMAKGVKEGVAGAHELKRVITAYKTAIKVKYKPLHDRIQNKLEYDLNSYVGDTKKLTDVVPTYSAKREAASAQLRQTGAEFIKWEKAGSQGAFKPSNEKAAVAALSAFVDVIKKMPYYSDAISATDAKNYDRLVYAASGGMWSKTTVEKLMATVAKFPGSV